MADILGTPGDDQDLFGTDQDDSIFGFEGFDSLFGSLGDDLIDGGADRDNVIYDVGLFTNGLTINNTSVTQAGVAPFTTDKRGFGTDTLVDVEAFTGSQFDDVIYVGGLGDAFTLDRAGDDLVVAPQDPNVTDDHFFAAGSGNDTYIGTVLRDRVDYSGDDFDAAGPIFQGVTVDLAAGTATDGWGGTDSLTSIERVRGTQFDDIIRGDDARNEFEGLEGDDTLDGRGGDRDRVRYDQEHERGGTQGVVVDLAAGTATDTFGDTDTLIDIEEVEGSEFDDTISGDENRNRLFGRDGDDVLTGVANTTTDDGDLFAGDAGSDTLIGSDGQDDYVDYSGDPAGAVIDLAAGIATDGYGDTDTLISIEDVEGTDQDDVILGNQEDNFIDGRAGDDELRGFGGDDQFRGGEGNDIIDGGADRDRVRYDREHEHGGTQGVVVDLTAGTATDTFGNTDTLISIEQAEGSIFDDTISGTDDDNRLVGEDGDDTLIGLDGDDDLQGDAGDDTLDGGVGGDFLQPGSGTDTVIGGANGPTGESDELSYIFDSIDTGTSNGITVTFTSEFDGTVIDYAGDTDGFTGIERVRGTNNADTFIGAEGRQQFRGFGGDDSFDGGAGDDDRVDYSRAQPDLGAFQGITVSLVTGIATDAYGDTDTLTNIEQIRGTDFVDSIVGNAERNSLDGEGGDDFIDTGGGVDNFAGGGNGSDTIIARGDSDFVDGGDGNDTITFLGEGGGVRPGLGSDTITGGTSGFFSIEYDGVGEDLIIDTGLGTTQFTVSGDQDIFTNIPNIGGGDGDDMLIGDDNEYRQEYFTSLGDDFIDGKGGDPRSARDTLIYDDRRETSVTVNFETGTATGTFAGTDTFRNIEGVRGTSGNDVFVGGSMNFLGGSSEITEYQGLDGVDSFTGGTGIDRISYTFDDNRGGSMGVVVDLAAGTGTDAFGNMEMFSSIEEIFGSVFGDTISGDDGENLLVGIEGSDTIDGREGDDRIFAGADADTLTGGAGSDLFGGRIFELDGDTITDFALEDRIGVFDNDFNPIGADIQVVGNELRIDTDGDGIAEATMFLTNGYSGPVQSEGGPAGGGEPVVFAIENAGAFSATVEEDATTVSLTVTRSGNELVAASVDVTVSGTGLNPADATDIASAFGTPQTVTFAVGETEQTIEVDIAEDAAIEPAEDLAVTLSNPVSGGSLAPEIAGAETFVRILNDDMPPTVSIEGGRAQEDSELLEFEVTRTGDFSQSLIVNYDLTSAGGLLAAESDDVTGGLPASGSVVIPAGSASAVFTVEPVADSTPELHDNIIATIVADPSWPTDLTVGVKQATGSIRNDDGVPPAPPVGATASSYGDPHLITLDGLAYDFQAVGEFVLIEATSSAPFLVQVRYGAVAGSDVASEATAVATKLGTARVTVDLARPDLVEVEGVALNLASAVGGASVGDGEIYYDGEAVTIVYASGEQLRIDLFADFLNTSVSIAATREVRGLLGNNDGDPTNDIALPDGTVLAQPVSFEELYGLYADAWRISDVTSLFDYPAGLGTADFTDLDFPAAEITTDDFPDDLVAAAEAEASGISDPRLREAAILDALVTGDLAEAIQSAETAVTPMISLETTGAPSLDAGIGVFGSVSEIVEGDVGAESVIFTVYRTGDTSEPLVVNYSFGGTAGPGDTDAAPGMLAFDAGETSRTIEVAILGDLAVEETETLIISTSLMTQGADAPLLLNGAWRVEILDNDVTSVGAPESAFLFEAVDTSSDETILTFVDGDTLQFGAETPPEERGITASYIGDGDAGDDDGSIAFVLRDGNGTILHEQFERAFPFALFGDSRGDFSVPDVPLVAGDYSLEVTAFSGNSDRSDVLATEEVAFSIAMPDGGDPPDDPVSVFEFAFVDTESDAPILTFVDGDTLQFGAETPPEERGITASYIGDGDAGDDDGSIAFVLRDGNGTILHEQFERAFPFALFGDSRGDFSVPDIPLVAGDYSLEVTAFSGNSDRSDVLATEEVAFSVLDAGEVTVFQSVLQTDEFSFV